MESVRRRFHGQIVAGVAGIVTDPNDRVLFVTPTRGPFAGYSVLPGGGIEPGERAEDALVREIREETGITVRGMVFVGLFEMIGRWANGSLHILVMVFRATSSEPIPSGFRGDNVGNIRWATPYEVKLHSTQRSILAASGFATFPKHETESALARDGISVRYYGQ